MELNVRFTARPSPGTGTRALVLIIVIITVVLARKTGYGPGTVFPAAAFTAALTAIQAARALACPGLTSLPGTGPDFGPDRSPAG
jgi:hypothetical protein